ncbi:unnamed protein product [Brassica rapa]|uniref:Uncharacterized protein n=1 Tax=Brassica campestris TaxID=3711 RepID=A0A8D9GZF0_BRACM|nr:unnamed protein product [Brassica rapa]
MLLGINYISLRSNQELTLETLLHSHRLVSENNRSILDGTLKWQRHNESPSAGNAFTFF